MRSFILALGLVLFTAVSLGCSSDPGVEGTSKDGEPTCQAVTCDEAGAQCGSTDDGCEGILDCGGCDTGVCGAGGNANICGTEGECVPRTCEDVGAECGLLDDGCNGVLDCSGCDGESGVVCSEDNQCVVLACGAEGKNECGTCGALPVEPGDACACEGSAACTVYGIQCDVGEATLLDDTDDGVDDWTEISGIAELTVQEAEYDEYRVVASDGSFSLLNPEFEIDHPGGYELNVCVVMDGLNGPVEAYCDGNDDAQPFIDDGVKHGCCLTMGADEARTHSFALDFPFLAPLHDYSARYSIQVRSLRAEQGVAVDSCEPYSVRYRF